MKYQRKYDFLPLWRRCVCGACANTHAIHNSIPERQWKCHWRQLMPFLILCAVNRQQQTQTAAGKTWGYFNVNSRTVTKSLICYWLNQKQVLLPLDWYFKMKLPCRHLFRKHCLWTSMWEITCQCLDQLKPSFIQMRKLKVSFPQKLNCLCSPDCW